jgi:hypothetical protein
MARWGVPFNSGGSSVKSVGLLVAAASSMRRAKITDWKIGCSQAPADNEFVHIIQACTTAGTGAARTPLASDAADTLAATIVAKDTITVDPTLTANAFFANFAVNQRASFRWVAAPYFELLIPATASNGYIFGVSAATTTTFAEDVLFEEL